MTDKPKVVKADFKANRERIEREKPKLCGKFIYLARSSESKK